MPQPLADLGQQLRDARERRGLTLADIAATTKIGTGALAAIERGDFRRLPGGIFRRAYVKAYANAAGLDGDAFARAYVITYEPPLPLPPPPPSKWAALRRPRVLAAAGLAAACTILLIALGAGARRSVVPGAGPTLSSDVGHATLVEPAGDPAIGEPAAEAEPFTLRLTIEVSADCWVSALADGERVVHRLVEPGESIQIAAGSAVTLRLGDAGAVALTINDVPARSLGETGEVATVHITPDNYQAMLPAGKRVAVLGERCDGVGWPACSGLSLWRTAPPV